MMDYDAALANLRRRSGWRRRRRYHFHHRVCFYYQLMLAGLVQSVSPCKTWRMSYVQCTSTPIELCDGAGDPSDAVVVVVEKGSERIAKRFTFAMSTLLSHNSTRGIECRWWDEWRWVGHLRRNRTKVNLQTSLGGADVPLVVIN